KGIASISPGLRGTSYPGNLFPFALPQLFMKNSFKSLRRSALPIGIGLLILSASLRAADWPQWRGPQRNGSSPEKGLLKEWPKEGPMLVWQTSGLGSGYSTPSVVGDRIYLLANEGLENEFVLALS